MRHPWSCGGLALVLAAASGWAEDARSPLIRVHVQVKEDAIEGLEESRRDVRQALYEGDTPSRLVHVPMDDADMVVLLNDRRTGLPAVHERGTDVNAARMLYRLSGVVVDARRQPQVLVGRGVVWRQAGSDLVRQLVAFAKEQEHALLRRRPDWPATGFEFEPLTKEMGRELGSKGGAVVVTAVVADSPAARAGLQVGDAIAKAGGRKVGGAGELARFLYLAPAGDPLRIEVSRTGSDRPLMISVP